MSLKQKYPLLALIFSLLVLGILTRVSQQETTDFPFLFRLMLSEFTFFVALSGAFIGYKLQKAQGWSFQGILILSACLIAALLLAVEGYHLWQMVSSAAEQAPQTILLNKNLQLS